MSQQKGPEQAKDQSEVMQVVREETGTSAQGSGCLANVPAPQEPSNLRLSAQVKRPRWKQAIWAELPEPGTSWAVVPSWG